MPASQNEFINTNRGNRQPGRAMEPLLNGYPVLREQPVPDVAIMISNCGQSAISLAVGSVNFSGPGVPNGNWSVPFKRIESAWVGCPVDAQAKKIRLTGSSDPCCQDVFHKGIAIEYRDGVDYQSQQWSKVFDCDCDGTLTEAQRVQKVADAINADPSAIVTAAVSTTNITLTAKTPGQDFVVTGKEGFITETLVQENIEEFGSGAHLLRKGFDITLLDLAADYNVISFSYEERVTVNQGPFGGTNTSTRPYMYVTKNVWVAFAASCSSLRTTLLATLNGTGTAANYLDTVKTDNCDNPTPTPSPSPSPTPSPSPSPTPSPSPSPSA